VAAAPSDVYSLFWLMARVCILLAVLQASCVRRGSCGKSFLKRHRHLEQGSCVQLGEERSDLFKATSSGCSLTSLNLPIPYIRKGRNPLHGTRFARNSTDQPGSQAHWRLIVLSVFAKLSVTLLPPLPVFSFPNPFPNWFLVSFPNSFPNWFPNSL
jgi:hypothetical protein